MYCIYFSLGRKPQNVPLGWVNIVLELVKDPYGFFSRLQNKVVKFLQHEKVLKIFNVFFIHYEFFNVI